MREKADGLDAPPRGSILMGGGLRAPGNRSIIITQQGAWGRAFTDYLKRKSGIILRIITEWLVHRLRAILACPPQWMDKAS